MSNTPSPVRRWAVPITVIVAAVVLFITAISLGQGRTDSPEEGSQAAGEGPVEVEAVETPDLSDIERRDEGDPLAVGPVDAPVGLVIFDDYQCPFCAQWSQDTLPLMMERVEEGELRIEWRQVNVFGDASLRAAQAAYAAALQGKHVEYHEALFAGGEPRPESELSEEALTELAGELGLDVDQFTVDFTSEETAEAVERNETLGTDLGAFSTPTFVLGGEPIVGAQPSSVFTDTFDAALAEG